MKYNIEIQMVTGMIHKANAIEIGNDWLNIIRNLDDAAYVQLPLSETKCVSLSPKHIVSVSMEEVVE